MSDQEKEPMFSAKNLKLFTAPLAENNPITVQVLGYMFCTGCDSKA